MGIPSKSKLGDTEKLSENVHTGDIKVVLGKHGGSVIPRLTRTIEDSAYHVFSDGHLQDVSGELNSGVSGINTLSPLKHLFGEFTEAKRTKAKLKPVRTLSTKETSYDSSNAQYTKSKRLCVPLSRFKLKTRNL